MGWWCNNLTKELIFTLSNLTLIAAPFYGVTANLTPSETPACGVNSQSYPE